MSSTSTRSPGFKLLMAGLVAFALVIPLFTVYLLVWDRQNQAETATTTNIEGWGDRQAITGPVLVIPYEQEVVEETQENGQTRSRSVIQRKELFLSPTTLDMTSTIDPEILSRSIYQTVVFDSENTGKARFALPEDFERYGIPREALQFDNAELRFGVSDPRGLQPGGTVKAEGSALALKPGKGLDATGGRGFFAFARWDGTGSYDVDFAYELRGNESLSLIPIGGKIEWKTKSDWPHPSFYGDFSPAARQVKGDGFNARHEVSNLALGQDLIATADETSNTAAPRAARPDLTSSSVKYSAAPGSAQRMTVGLIEPVDLYSLVDRSVKYGFLFIGFTFLAFLLFDLVGGARVAAAEYLLTGAGLVLFFVMLLAFAEVIGFGLAYLVAAGAITGLLTAYSAAVLGNWKRARIIGALLVALYGALYVLLNLEGLSLLIGSLMLFAALAIVMWSTRAIDWSRREPGSDRVEETPADGERPPATVKNG